MNCLNCGNPIPEEAKFCPVCGTPVPTDSVAEAVAEPVVEAEAAPAVQDAPTESWYQSSAQQNVPPVTPVFVSSKPTIGSIFDFYRKAFSVLAKKPIRLWGLSLLYFFIASIVSSLGSLVPLISLPIVLVLGLGFTGVLLDAFPNRIINLHPALLPSFVGAHAIQDAFDAGVKVTGVTVHFANEEYDKGPIIAQRAVVVRESDTVDTLEERIHEVEHEMYPQVLGWLADGRVEVQSDGKVRIYE